MGSFIHHRSTTLFVILILCSWETECRSESEPNHWGLDRGRSGDTSQNYFFYQRSEYSRDCQEVLRGCQSLNQSGIYVIKPDSYLDPLEVYCDHDENSNGWTVIQRRVEGSVNFERSWQEYKYGFGFLSNDFWLGNEILSYMTNQGVYELRMDMELSNGSSFYVTYDSFRISDEWDDYKILQVGGSSSSGAIVVNTQPIFQTSCPATLEIEAANGTETAVATFSPPVCNDTGDIGVITSVCSSADGLTSGSAFPIGTTTVTCTCTDTGSLTDSCSFLVQVYGEPCESGWLTYDGSCYRVYEDTITWPEANSVSTGIDSRLVWVESEGENQFLRENVAGYFWLGIRDVTEGVWRYEGTSDTLTYSRWSPNEPNNTGGDEDCGAMRTSGFWNDYRCTNQLKFVCEMA